MRLLRDPFGSRPWPVPGQVASSFTANLPGITVSVATPAGRGWGVITLRIAGGLDSPRSSETLAERHTALCRTGCRGGPLSVVAALAATSFTSNIPGMTASAATPAGLRSVFTLRTAVGLGSPRSAEDNFSTRSAPSHRLVHAQCAVSNCQSHGGEATRLLSATLIG